MIAERTKQRLTHVMQLLLAAMLVYGVWRLDIKLIVNTGVPLLISVVPELQFQRQGRAVHPGIMLWITAAVFLHAIGGLFAYSTYWWWDHLTHTLSATVVAGAGYLTVRIFQERSDKITLPDRFTLLFVLLFVMAFGVVWEVLEYGLAFLARLTGTLPLLAQHGLANTMKDLGFDTVGALVTAAGAGIRSWKWSD